MYKWVGEQEQDMPKVGEVAAGIRLVCGNCLDVLPTLPSGSVDAVITDPPYPEVDRPYGKLTEAEWHEMMQAVVLQCRRVLTSSGSAVFILQPNSRKVGSLRAWLWDFMGWAAREWNQVQDAWWWNFTAVPTVHTHRTNALMRPSIKALVWLGEPDCYRNQEEVLWEESQSNMAVRQSQRVRPTNPYYSEGGNWTNKLRATTAAADRGGVTPFNLLPFSNTNSHNSGGANGHGAATPFPLVDWWVRYICPPGGTVLDPFVGSGTTALACMATGRRCAGIDKEAAYIEIASRRVLEEVRSK